MAAADLGLALGEVLLVIIWGVATKKKIGGTLSVILGIVTGILGYVVLINWFIGITHFMGEMDYALM